MTADSTDPFEKTDFDPKFKTLVEEIPDFALFLLDPDGRIISWNRGARQITGYDSEEILGKKVSILAPADLDERNEPWAIIEEAVENNGCQIEDWCRRKDGSSFWASGVIKPIQAEDDSLRGFVVIARNLTERKEHTDNLEAIFDNSFELTGLLEPDGTVVEANKTALEFVDAAREEVIGGKFWEMPWFQASEESQREIKQAVQQAAQGKFVRDEIVAGKADQTEVFDYSIRPLTDDQGNVTFLIPEGRGITKRKQQEHRLKQQRDALEILTQTQQAIQEIIQELTESTTRENLEQLICDHLADSELYTCAVIVEFGDSPDEVSPRTWAGIDDDIDGEIWKDPLSGGGSNLGSSIRAGRSYVIQELSTDSETPESEKADSRDQSGKSAIAVPLADRDLVFGALIVCSERPTAFTEREQIAFETLGEITSFSITALENQQLLIADAVVELTLRSSEPEAAFYALADRLDCSCSLDGLTFGQDGNLISYVSLNEASPERVRRATEAIDSIKRCRVVSRTDECQLRLACVLSDGFLSSLVDAGASIRSALADQNEAKVLVEVASAEDVSSALDAVNSVDPSWELVGKRTVDRTAETTQDRYQAVVEKLTDKQLQALKAAYLAGYYEHPRHSTATEIAKMLGITDSTLHEHLQSAQRKLLEEFFDTTELA